MSIPPSVRLPAGVNAVTIAAEHGELAGLRTAGAGPAVLLVPGFTGSKEDFLPLLPLLAQSDRTVLAIDQHGQYQSAGPDEDAAYSMAAWAADVVSLAEGLGGDVDLVGHSFGGLVCREAVLASPQVFRSLVLLDSGPGALPPHHHDRLAALAAVIPEWDMERIWQVKEQLDRSAGVPPPPAPIQEFLHTRWVSSSPGALKAMAHLLVTCPDRTGDLRAVLDAGLPCEVMFGEHDSTSWDIPEMVDMAQRLSVAAVAIPDAAHSPAVENPTVTAERLLAFWSRVNGK